MGKALDLVKSAGLIGTVGSAGNSLLSGGQKVGKKIGKEWNKLDTTGKVMAGAGGVGAVGLAGAGVNALAGGNSTS